MDHNPKKSRALIITIVVVVLLLIVGYFLYSRNAQQTTTKGSSGSSSGNFFTSLFGSSKPKSLTVVDQGNNSAGNSTSSNPSTTTTNNGTTSSSGSIENGSLVPPEPFTPGSDFNGGDGFTQNKDSIAVGSGIESNTPYVPGLRPIPTPDQNPSRNGTGTSGSGGATNSTPSIDPATTPGRPKQTPTVTISTPPSICPADDPLVFTDQENIQLADLLRQYYLIASTLKTEDDIDLVNNDILQNEALMQQVDELTQDCKVQKADPLYTGPQTIKNNPYYAEASNTTSTYLFGQVSNWITTSEYYKSSYGRPTINSGGFNFNQAGFEIPDAFRGKKIQDYADFEEKFNIW